ncbi:MAG TPA: hypothetical protein PL070_03440, partial [Flavobacteriales bacterium]|nr:hypothetical protein [Flavobacteriales bacterium]
MKTFNGIGTAQFPLNEMTSGNLRIGMAYESGTSLMVPSGTIIQTLHYAIDTMLALQSVKRYSDTEFYFTASYYKDICSETGIRRMYPVIGRMDSLGVITAVRHYDLAAPHCVNRGGISQPQVTVGPSRGERANGSMHYEPTMNWLPYGRNGSTTEAASSSSRNCLVGIYWQGSTWIRRRPSWLQVRQQTCGLP